MSDQTNVVICRDYTAGRRPPRTASRLSPDMPRMPWGRVDIAVYLIAAPVIVLSAIVLLQFGLWTLLIQTSGLLGVLLGLVILVVPGFLAGMAANAAGVDYYGLRRGIFVLGGLVPKVGDYGVVGGERASAEPHAVLDGTMWLLTDPPAKRRTWHSGVSEWE